LIDGTVSTVADLERAWAWDSAHIDVSAVPRLWHARFRLPALRWRPIYGQQIRQGTPLGGVGE